jgi:hypothetical protein
MTASELRLVDRKGAGVVVWEMAEWRYHKCEWGRESTYREEHADEYDVPCFVLLGTPINENFHL